MDWNDWRELELPLTAEGATAWGKESDQKLDYPLTLHEIILDKTSADLPATGAVFIDDVRLQTTLAANELFALSLNLRGKQKLLTPGDKEGTVEVIVHNYARKKGRAELTCELRDFAGVVLQHELHKLNLDKKPTVTRTIRVPTKSEGAFTVSATLTYHEQDYRAELGVSVLGPALLPGPRPDSPFGINGHLARDDEMAMMARAGIKWMRADWLWSVCQPKPGPFQWDLLDDRAANAKAHGIELLPILCYTVDWASTAPADAPGRNRHMPDLDAWLNYVRAVVERYHGRIHYWEVWNEPNIGFWRGTAEQYCDLFRATARAIRETDPQAKVVMGGTAGAPPDWLEMLYQAGLGELMDVINIHPYRYPKPPDEGLAQAIKAVRAVMTEHGDGDKPLWITEIGWPNHIGPRGVNLYTQAAYLARTYVIALASGVQRLFWYDYQNGTDPTYNEHNFGIVFADNTPKPCFHALRTMSLLLDGAVFRRKLKTPPRTAGYLFRRGDTPVLALWSLDGRQLVGLKTKPPMYVIDLMGHRRKITLEEGVNHLGLSEAPIFVEVPSEHFEFAPEAVLRFDPPRRDVFPGTQVPWTIEVQNYQARSWLRATLLIDFPPEWAFNPERADEHPEKKQYYRQRVDFAVPPDRTKAITLQVGAQRSDYRLYPVRAHLYRLTDADKQPEGPPLAEARGEIDLRSPVKIALRPAWQGQQQFVEAELRGQVADVDLNCLLTWSIATAAGLYQPQGRVALPALSTEVAKARLKAPVGPAGADVKLTLETEQGAEVVAQRHLTFARLPAAPAAPAINGDLTDWPGPVLLRLQDKAQVRLMDDWRGPEDLSARARLMWDEAALYVGVEVTDDKLVQDQPLATAWQGDSVQIAVAGSFPAQPNDDYRQFDIPAKAPTAQVLRRGRGLPNGQWVPQVRAAMRRAGNQTIYEIALPWQQLELKPRPGLTFAFSLLVNDNDGSGRRGWIEWGSGIGLKKDPSQYYDVTLSGHD